MRQTAVKKFYIFIGTEVRDHVHRSLPLVYILCQVNPAHILIPLFFNIHFWLFEQYHLSFTAECCVAHRNIATDLPSCSSQLGSIPVTSLVDLVLIFDPENWLVEGVMMNNEELMESYYNENYENQRVRLILLLMVLYGWDSSVGIVTHYRLNGPGNESW